MSDEEYQWAALISVQFLVHQLWSVVLLKAVGNHPDPQKRLDDWKRVMDADMEMTSLAIFASRGTDEFPNQVREALSESTSKIVSLVQKTIEEGRGEPLK